DRALAPYRLPPHAHPLRRPQIGYKLRQFSLILSLPHKSPDRMRLPRPAAPPRHLDPLDLASRHAHSRRPLAEPAKIDRQRAIVVALPQRAEPVANPRRPYAKLWTFRHPLPALQLRRRRKADANPVHWLRRRLEAQFHRRRPLLQQKRFAVENLHHRFPASPTSQTSDKPARPRLGPRPSRASC